jgi:hypothetical protein
MLKIEGTIVLNQQIKYFSFPFGIFLLIIAVFPGFGQYVTLEGKQFKDRNGDNFYPLVCNYLVEYIYKDHDTSRLIITPDRSCDGWCFNCKDLTSCLNQMTGNFTRIKKMGFNAIRLTGSNPNYYYKPGETEGWKIKASDFKYADSTHCDNSSLNRYHNYYFCQPFSSNPTARLLFALIDSVLVRAGKAGLYVILVAGGGAGDYSLNYPEQYAEYLKALAKHIRTVSPKSAKEALLAYDLDNEPSSSWSYLTLWPISTIGHSKQDVYENVKLFNKKVKKADPDHLTTLGGGSFQDVFEYDPAILTVDFYSPHFYPESKSYDPSPFNDKLDRIHGHYVWLSNNLSIPYLVGETGFRSEPGGTGPDGDNEQQKQYAQYTLDLTRYYGGSGYSWWNYQDYNWSKNDRFYGLSYWDNKSRSLVEKPVADAFRNWDPKIDPPAFQPPDNYYDPFNHGYYNHDHNHLRGHIQDQDGNPVKDAFVQGWTGINTNSNGKTYYEVHYTFSDPQGDFTIIPYDYDPVNPPNNEVIAELRVSAPGYSRFRSGWYDNDTGVPPDSVKVIILQKLHF